MLTRRHDAITYVSPRTMRQALSDGYDWLTAPQPRTHHRADLALYIVAVIAIVTLLAVGYLAEPEHRTTPTSAPVPPPSTEPSKMKKPLTTADRDRDRDRDPYALSERERERLAQLITHLAAHHTGRGSGVRADILARAIGTHPRQLRKLISAARHEGTAILGDPGAGYYIAATAAELDECCSFLRARAMHSLHLEAQLRRIPLPDLVGQLRLPT